MEFQQFLKHAILPALCLPLVATCGPSPTPLPIQLGQHPHTSGKVRSQVNYLLFLPQDYGGDPDQRWPLMIFLHGIGNRGDTLEELEALKKDGPPMIVEQQPDYPFVVLSPQCPSDSFWESELDKLDALLDEVLETYAIDPHRIYLTGLSMGGYGAWHYALKHPERFAAVVPIAGGYIHGSEEVPEKLCDLKDVPIWVFHGAADDVVLPRQSEVLVEALQACPANVRFTLYPEASHDQSWKLAYADLELYDWLLAQSLD